MDPMLQTSDVTNGCKVQLMLERYRKLQGQCDVLVIGADSKHGGKHQTFKRKAGLLREAIRDRAGALSVTLVPAIADPSVEAWLLSDPTALKVGLGRALELGFAMPRHWPTPTTEREAKRDLGKVIRDGTGAVLPLGGFEYAPAILEEMELMNSRNPSLAEWAREMERAFRSSTSR